MEVKCDYCEKHLFTTKEKSMGKIAFEATKLNLVVKYPMVYGIAEFKIFCCEDCKKKWFAENITPEVLEKGNKSIEEFKAYKAQIIEGLSKDLGHLSKAMKKIEDMTPEEYQAFRENTLKRLKARINRETKNYGER